MDLPFDKIIKGLWCVLGAYWLWSARHVKAPARRESTAVRLAKYWLPLLAAGALLGPGNAYDGEPWLKLRLLPDADWVRLLGCVVTLCGVLFACRARQVLGDNWSVAVQLKQGHALIERGPYRWVRHPIYSGLLLAFLGTALAVGEVRGFIALAIIAVSFWFKLRLEERWLGESFGAAYVDYSSRVKALVPGLL